MVIVPNNNSDLIVIDGGKRVPIVAFQIEDGRAYPITILEFFKYNVIYDKSTGLMFTPNHSGVAIEEYGNMPAYDESEIVPFNTRR